MMFMKSALSQGQRLAAIQVIRHSTNCLGQNSTHLSFRTVNKPLTTDRGGVLLNGITGFSLASLLIQTGRSAGYHQLLTRSPTGKCTRRTSQQMLYQVKSFHTSPQRHIPPVIWLFIKPVAKLGAILSGRTARKWWQALPNEGKQDFYSGLRQRWYYVVLVLAGLAGAGVTYYTSHIEETPVTRRKRFVTVTHDQCLKIFKAESDGLLEQYEDKLLPPSHPYYERLKRVGERLSAANPDMKEIMGKEWTYYIIDERSTINACVLPTGEVFVYTGIMDFAQNEDQLAVIIAHEMAHAVLNHGIEQISYVQLIDFLIISTMAAIWCIMPNDGISLVTQWFYNKIIYMMLHMPYSRMLEKEADNVGLQFAAKACFDVREASVFWSRVAFNEDISDPDDKVPEWISTHPSHKNRVDFFDFMVPQAEQLRDQAQCPKLSTKDPRTMIKEMSSLVDNHNVAKKTGQNLSRIQVMVPGEIVTKAS